MSSPPSRTPSPWRSATPPRVWRPGWSRSCAAGATAAAFSVFPHDLVNAPREFAQRFFDVRVWREEARGGHFAAWEQPALYAAGVNDAVRLAA